MKFENASQKPKLFYGLHMAPGLAEYQKLEGAERILIDERAIKNMDNTFSGCPVFVDHVDGVDLKNLEKNADGYVVRSFYNKSDGKHWVEFMAVSDKAHEAIKKGWRLSNAYIPKGTYGSGGTWHGLDYDKEILDGEYEHLAIVQNPRYDESVIFTPEEFKRYNSGKEIELERFANSKDKKGDKSMFKFFERKQVDKVENQGDLEKVLVILPKSGKEKTIEQVVNELDAIYNMNGYANPDHVVKVGENEMSVKELSEQYNEMCIAKKNEEDAKKKAEEEEKEKAKNKNASDKKEDHFETLRNAHLKNNFTVDNQIVDGIALGKQRYGLVK